MSLGVKAVSYGSEICREWAASVRRNPLRKGVLRCVTIAKDDAITTMGKLDEMSFLEVIRPKGVSKLIIKHSDNGKMFKCCNYPDGSYYNTDFLNGKPVRTNGEFVVKKKDGSVLNVGYGVSGEYKPDEMKKVHLANLHTLGNPKYEVNLREVFSDKPVSKLQKFIDKVGRFFKKFNKLNRELREYAKSIDLNS